MPVTIDDVLLWTGAAGTAAFLLVVIVEGWLRTDYSPVREPVSALALGPRGRVQIANFAVAGLAVTAGGVGVLLHGAGLILALGIMVFGVGLLLSAFPMDPGRGYPPGAPDGDPTDPSVSHRIHDLAGAVVFFSLPVVAVTAVFTLAEWWMRFSAAAVVLILVVALSVWTKDWEDDSARSGLTQRLFIVPGWLWLASVFSVLAVG